MVRGIPVKPLTIVLLLTTLALAAAEQSNILVTYSFDDTNIATGPDTFTVFEGGKGSVRLTTRYSWSGYRSVELTDVAGDGDFPELRGSFAQVTHGTLYIYFAFMTTDPSQPLNIALVGPRWFNLQKDGMGLWLKTRDSHLYHVSDSMPKRLFALEPFTWYMVDVAYDIDAGRYDLTIFEEEIPEARVDLRAQPNAANQPGSVVDTFSFVTDPFRDSSTLTYYVDDVVVSYERVVVQDPMAAPGRRKLFIDMWDDYQHALREGPGCLPATALADFGIVPGLLEGIYGDGELGKLLEALSHQPGEGEVEEYASGRHGAYIEAVRAWKRGCAALAERDPAAALELFDEATILVPEGRIFELSRVLALIGMGEFEEAEYSLAWIRDDWVGESSGDDLRYSITEALVLTAIGEGERARAALMPDAFPLPLTLGEDFTESMFTVLWRGALDRELMGERGGAGDFMPHGWHGFRDVMMAAEQFYYALLWLGEYTQASRYADAMVVRMSVLEAPSTKWIERSGDAEFFDGDCARAREQYLKALGERTGDTWLYLKLSDVSHCLGDSDGEKDYREKVYGTLEKG